MRALEVADKVHGAGWNLVMSALCGGMLVWLSGRWRWAALVYGGCTLNVLFFTCWPEPYHAGEIFSELGIEYYEQHVTAALLPFLLCLPWAGSRDRARVERWSREGRSQGRVGKVLEVVGWLVLLGLIVHLIRWTGTLRPDPSL